MLDVFASDGRLNSATITPLMVAAPPRKAGAVRRRWESRYVWRLLLADLLVAVCAAGAAPLMRFGPEVMNPYNRLYVWVSLVLPLAWVAALALCRGYEPRFLFVGNEEYHRVFRAGLGLTATIAVSSFALDARLARGYILIAMPFAVMAGIAGRYLLRHRVHVTWTRGDRLSRVLLAGHPEAVSAMARQLSRERYHGMGVVGACVPVGSGPGAAGLPIFGSFDDIAGAVGRADADTVLVLSCPELTGPALRRLAWQVERDEVDLIVSASLLDVAGDRTTIRPVDGLPLLHVEHPRLRGARRAVKDLTDRLLAVVILALVAPLLGVLALLVRFEPGGRGPVFFRQVRVGQNGRPFTMWKLRTMHVDAEQRLAALLESNESDGVLFKMQDDPRVTRTGRWLRRFSLDELPQLFNVLLGDMSLVGPRPPLPAEVARYPQDMRRRLVVKPGMTGLWQVSGRSKLSWEDTIRLDLRYVENWSLTMDLVILARTLSAVLRSSGAY